VKGGIIRLSPLAYTDPHGVATKSIDTTQILDPGAQIVPGSTWHFQYWYRDPGGGGPGVDLSDGLRVTFCP
jgi:hypothetical protein